MILEITKPNLPVGNLALEKAVRDNKVHLICVANYGLTNYGGCAHLVRDLGPMTPEEYAEQVNMKNEPGTFYPKVAMTILPFSRGTGRDDTGNTRVMGRHIEDCFEANEKYAKSPEIYFALDSIGVFDAETFCQVLREKLTVKNDWIHAKKISMTRNE